MPSTNTTFAPVADVQRAETLFAGMRQCVRREGDGTFELRRRTAVVALPGISNAHLSVEDQGRVAAAFEAASYPVVYAMALETLKGVAPVFEVPCSPAGMSGFQHACGHFNYALCSPDMRAVVVCSTDDFLVYLGPDGFVEACAGRSSAEAVQVYRDYVDSYSRMPAMQRILRAVDRALLDEYPKAPEGSAVRFPVL